MTVDDVLGIDAEYASRVEREFATWIETPDGRLVMGQVIDRAIALRIRGFDHYSIDAILHAIRIDRDLAVGPDRGFKINNDRGAHLARRVMRDVATLDGFFSTRVLHGRR